MTKPTNNSQTAGAPDDNDRFERAVSDYVQQQLDSEDPSTRSRLDQIRQQAVAQAAATDAHHSGSWMANLGYAAAFTLAVTAGILTFNSEPDVDVDDTSALELVLLNTDFEMMEEELNFYQWLETELEND